MKTHTPTYSHCDSNPTQPTKKMSKERVNVSSIGSHRDNVHSTLQLHCEYVTAEDQWRDLWLMWLPVSFWWQRLYTVHTWCITQRTRVTKVAQKARFSFQSAGANLTVWFFTSDKRDQKVRDFKGEPGSDVNTVLSPDCQPTSGGICVGLWELLGKKTSIGCVAVKGALCNQLLWFQCTCPVMD